LFSNFSRSDVTWQRSCTQHGWSQKQRVPLLSSISLFSLASSFWFHLHFASIYRPRTNCHSSTSLALAGLSKAIHSRRETRSESLHLSTISIIRRTKGSCRARKAAMQFHNFFFNSFLCESIEKEGNGANSSQSPGHIEFYGKVLSGD
jgi:hypothetical protein